MQRLLSFFYGVSEIFSISLMARKHKITRLVWAFISPGIYNFAYNSNFLHYYTECNALRDYVLNSTVVHEIE